MTKDEKTSRLIIHTAERADRQASGGAPETPIADLGQTPPRRTLPSLTRQNKARPPRARRTARARSEEIKPLTVGERLMRNTAIACALLLAVMAVKNINQPWSDQATAGIKQAMTMRLNLDETLGRLKFVRSLLPEAALVFMNLSGDDALASPVNGTLVHYYSEQQPWMEYQCEPAQPVYAAAEGTVTTVGQGAQGDYIVLIEHEDGLQTVYAYLESVEVKSGDMVEVGAPIGKTANQEKSRLYFELREEGDPVDPSGMLRGSGT